MSRPVFDPDTEHGPDEVAGPGGFEPLSVGLIRSVSEANQAVGAKAESPIELNLGTCLVRLLEGTDVQVVPQYEWLRFRMDFALIRQGKVRAFIECDGKKYHSTAEQIANDRRKDDAAARSGIPLLRFSGAAIYRDPEGCAKAAVSWAFE